MTECDHVSDICIFPARLAIKFNRVNARNIQFRMPDLCGGICFQPADDVIPDLNKFIYRIIIDFHTILSGVNHGKKLSAKGYIILDVPAF